MPAPPPPEHLEFTSGPRALHAWRWDRGGDAILLCLHGWLDMGYSFRWFAEALDFPCTVIALDTRGHGRSAWPPAGEGYLFPDYLVDLTAVARALAQPVMLLGHSMGGNIVSHWAAMYPEHVRALVNIEGYGPPEAPVSAAPGLARRFIEGVLAPGHPPPHSRRYPNLAEVAARLQAANPRLAPTRAADLAAEAVVPAPEGGLVWRFDPRHRLPPAGLFWEEQALAFYAQLRAPALLVDGAESEFKGDRFGRLRAGFRGARLSEVAGAGHMVHHDQPEALAAAVAGFLREI